MSDRNIPAEDEGLPRFFSPPRFFLDAPKQPLGTCFVLNADFQRAMAEIERLRGLINRVIEWKPALPAESSLLDELAAAVKGLPAETSVRIGPDTPNNDMVICPNCTSQFVAIPVNVQKQLRAAETGARICGRCSGIVLDPDPNFCVHCGAAFGGRFHVKAGGDV